MNFEFSQQTEQLRARVGQFVAEHIAPNDAAWQDAARQGRMPMELIDPLKDRAKAAGLWNLFLPSLRPEQPGTRLTNLEYAPLAEVMGRYPWAAEIFNCNSPDSGNMEILQLCATPEQRAQWLDPLLDGRIRSCFSMTEPGTASSDPTNLETTITMEGNQYRVRGRKWFSTGALHPNCKVAIVMGRSDV